MSKSIFPHLLNAYLNWTNEVLGKCHLEIDLTGIDDPVLQQHKSPLGNVIVLNIGGSAVTDLAFEEDVVRFKCTFSGRPHQAVIPYSAIFGIVGPDGQSHLLAYLSIERTQKGQIEMHTPRKVATAVAPQPKKSPLTLVK